MNRAESDLEREELVAGAVLAADTVAKAQRVLSVLPPASTMQDPVARAVLTLAADMVARGELPSAATIFVEGTAGPRSLFSAEDRERLRSWQIDGELEEHELVTIGRTLFRSAQNRRVGDTLVALGTAIKSGMSRQGTPFGYSEGRRYFEQIGRDYDKGHAAGVRGPEAVALTRARAEERWKNGKTNSLPSGMPAFDKLFGGYPRQLCNVLGHQGRGKSTFISTQLGLHALMGLKPVIFVTEDDFTAAVDRHVALRMGMKRRDVYSKPFDDDAKAHDVEVQLAKEWEGVTFYTLRHGNTVEDVLRLFTAHVLEDDSQVFYLDNITGLSHAFQGRNDTVHDAAARSLHRMQQWTESWGRALIVASHTSTKYWERTRGRLHPEMSETADTGGASNAGRYYRFGVGVYQAGETLRFTNIKNNIEGALEARKATVAFDAHVDQGLIDVDSGREVNLAEEARHKREDEARQKLANKDAEAKRTQDRNRAWAEAERQKKEALKAAELAKQPAQGELLHVETPKERT